METIVRVSISTENGHLEIGDEFDIQIIGVLGDLSIYEDITLVENGVTDSLEDIEFEDECTVILDLISKYEHGDSTAYSEKYFEMINHEVIGHI